MNSRKGPCNRNVKIIDLTYFSWYCNIHVLSGYVINFTVWKIVSEKKRIEEYSCLPRLHKFPSILIERETSFEAMDWWADDEQKILKQER